MESNISIFSHPQPNKKIYLCQVNRKKCTGREKKIEIPDRANKGCPILFQVTIPSHTSKPQLQAKMTILSNHRLHTYKASAACHNRDITPKKRAASPLHKIHLRKRSASPPKKYLKVQTTVVEPQSVPLIMKEEERTLMVWGEEYTIKLPQGYDIYEGLRRWYPSLYEAVLQEEKLNKYEDAYNIEEDPLDMEEEELVWEKHDYLEWLFD